MDSEDDQPEDLPERDFSRYLGYWHGFTFIIFDEQNPDQWIRSTYWVPVASDEDADQDRGEQQPD